MGKGKFIKITCKKCNEERIIFSCATTKVRCPGCGEMQNVPKGGKCEIVNSKVEKVLR